MNKENDNKRERIGEHKQIVDILVGKLKDECNLIAQIMLKDEKGEELTTDEQLLLINWLPFLGEIGMKAVHAMFSKFKGYEFEQLQLAIERQKVAGYISCLQLKEQGICKMECDAVAKFGSNPSPVLVFIGKDKSSLPEMFRSMNETEQYLVLETKKNQTFRVANFNIYKGVISSRLEFLIGDKAIYSDTISISSGKSRKQFVNKCQEMAGGEKLNLLELEKCLIGIEEVVRNKLDNLSKNTSKQDECPKMTSAEKVEALAFLRDPKILEVIKEDLRKLGHVGEEENKLLIYIICTSRKLKKPLACIVRAASSAGKNMLAGTILDLFPEEEKRVLSRITPNALYYLVQHGLENKILYIAERSGSEESDYPVRTLLSEGRLTVWVPVRNPKTDMLETQRIEVRGPVAYLETSTKAILNDENLTRLFSIFIDESEPQTVLIHEIQRRDKTLAGLIEAEERCRIKRKHQNAQRLLKPINVVMPYAESITFPTHSVRTRRDHEKFLYLIMTVAFLRQYQKEHKLKGDILHVEADVLDYEIAYELSRSVLGQTIDEVSKKSRDLMVIIVDMVRAWFDDKKEQREQADKEQGRIMTNIVFRRADVRKHAKGWSDSAIYSSMRELSRYELLRVVQGGKQGLTFKYTLVGETENVNFAFNKLLTPAQLKASLELEVPSLPEVSQKSYAA
ncbi:hypothetical protein ACFL2J_00160 [Candidatus Omnitrophota bacterium]